MNAFRPTGSVGPLFSQSEGVSKLGASQGGKATVTKLSAKRRSQIAKEAQMRPQVGALTVSVSVCLSRERVTKPVDVLANGSQFAAIEVIKVNVHVPSGPAGKSHRQIQM